MLNERKLFAVLISFDGFSCSNDIRDVSKVKTSDRGESKDVLIIKIGSACEALKLPVTDLRGQKLAKGFPCLLFLPHALCA
jgi:hypothetical protein